MILVYLFFFFSFKNIFENLQIEEFEAGLSWKFFGFLLDLNDCISPTDYFGAVLAGYLLSFKSDALFKYFLLLYFVRAFLYLYNECFGMIRFDQILRNVFVFLIITLFAFYRFGNRF